MTDHKPDGEVERWQESLRIAAEEYLRLRQRYSDLYNAGEGDPKTDEFKVASMAFEIAADRYRELSKPREILALLRARSTQKEATESERLRAALAKIASLPHGDCLKHPTILGTHLNRARAIAEDALAGLRIVKDAT